MYELLGVFPLPSEIATLGTTYIVEGVCLKDSRKYF